MGKKKPHKTKCNLMWEIKVEAAAVLGTCGALLRQEVITQYFPEVKQ